MTAVIFGARNVRQMLDSLLGDGNTVADYKPGYYTGTLNASAWANSIGAAGPLLQATGANQPIILSSDSVKKAYLPGVAGNSFSTPDKAALASTVSISIRARITADDWTPAANKMIGGQYRSVAASDGQGLYIDTTGVLKLLLRKNPTTTATATSTAAPTVTDGSAIWVRADYVIATTTTTFYTSSDGSTWAQLGNAVVTATIDALQNGTDSLFIGINTDNINLPFAGKIYNFQYYSDGALAVEFAASDWPSETSTNGATQASSTTGEVWTLNNTGAKLAQIVASPQLLFDGTAGTMAAAFTLAAPCTRYLVGNQVTWTANDFIWDGVSPNDVRLWQTGVSPNIQQLGTLTGAQSVQWLLNTYGVVIDVRNGASSSLKVDGNAPAAGNPGTGDPGGMTLGSRAGPSLFGNIQVKEVIIRTVADSAAVQAQIQTLLKALYGTP